MGQKIIAIPLVIIIGLWLGNYFEKRSEKKMLKNSVAAISQPVDSTKEPIADAKSATSPSAQVAKSEEDVTEKLKPNEIQAPDLALIENFFNSGKAPVSYGDLKRRSVPLKLPLVPGKEDEVDIGIVGVYTGYIFEAPATLRKIKISTGIVNKKAHEGSLSIEEGGKFSELPIESLAQKNFADDRYSFVYELPDGRYLYLKIFENIYFEKFSMKLRALSGWIVDPRSKRIFKVALMDDMSVVDQKPWPDRELIEPLLPKKTLRP